MPTTKKIKIGLFPRDNRLWKVNWLANVTINPLVKSEPTIIVFLTRLKASVSDSIDLSNPNNFDKTYKEVVIGVGHLSLVNIDSVWQNGIKVKESIQTHKYELKVDTSFAKPISFSEKTIVGDKRLLTPFQYPTGSAAYNKIKDSPIIAIPYDGDPYGLLIPAIEIIRFYHLMSSPMARAVFYGVFNRLTTDVPCFYTQTKQAVFMLNWGVGENNVWNIARYLSSDLTKQRVADIHDWVVLNSINKFEQKSHSTFFPFDGETKLQFEGTKIKDEDGNERYFCTKLKQCSGKFLFDSVLAYVMKSYISKEDYEEELANPTVYWPLYTDKPASELSSSEEPSKKHLTMQFIDHDYRFTDLEFKTKEIQTSKRSSVMSAITLYDSKNNGKEISTAEGTYGASDKRKADIGTDLDPKNSPLPVPDRLTLIISVLAYLRSQDGISVKTLAISLPDKYVDVEGYNQVNIWPYLGETIVGCFKVGNQKNKWVELDLGTEIKSRGIIIAEVSFKSKILYLMELEQYQNSSTENNCSLRIQFKRDYSEIKNDELYNFVYRCGLQQRWPQITKEESAVFNKVTLNHSGKNLKERTADAIAKVFAQNA